MGLGSLTDVSSIEAGVAVAMEVGSEGRLALASETAEAPDCRRILLTGADTSTCEILVASTWSGVGGSGTVSSSLFCIHFDLAKTMLANQGQFDDAHAHIQRAKLHAVDHHDMYVLAHAVKLRAELKNRP